MLWWLQMELARCAGGHSHTPSSVLTRKVPTLKPDRFVFAKPPMISKKLTSLWASPWSLTPVLLKAKPWMWFWRWPKMFTCWTLRRVPVDSSTYALPKKSTMKFSMPQAKKDAHLAAPFVCSRKRTSAWSPTLVVDILSCNTGLCMYAYKCGITMV